jgi:hypothetical protein
MKRSVKSLLLFAACSFLSATSQYTVIASAKSQGGRIINTCSELQRRANKVSWEYKTIFQGFDNLPMDTSATIANAGNDRLCQLGYITEFTPMGKEVCQGNIYTDIKSNRISWSYGHFRPNLHSPVNNKSDFCRYVN